MNSVICNYCGNQAELVAGDVIYPHRTDLSNKRFWLCRDCDAFVGCHKNSENGSVPLGTLANKKLREKRSVVHMFFDPIWKTKKMKRDDAYQWLADKMNIPKNDCHIAMFSVNKCREALRILQKNDLCRMCGMWG